MNEILKEFKKKVNYREWYVDGVDLVEMATILLKDINFEFDAQDILAEAEELLVQSLLLLILTYLCMYWKVGI